RWSSCSGNMFLLRRVNYKNSQLNRTQIDISDAAASAGRAVDCRYDLDTIACPCPESLPSGDITGKPMTQPGIPLIDVAALFHGPAPNGHNTAEKIAAAAGDAGFSCARVFPADLPTDRSSREDILRIFRLPDPQIRPLWRRKFDPSHSNVYRGWFPLQTGFLTSKEGIDLGPDVAYGPSAVVVDDPLREATPLPPEDALPGWRASIERYYLGMVRVSEALMRSLARGLTLPEHFFDQAFERGISTLRLIHYPPRADLDQVAKRDPHVWIEHQGRRH